MATNYVQPGNFEKLPVTAGALSGDPDMVGDLSVVLTEDADSNDEAMCALEGVYDLDVEGADASANVAMSVGDPVYWDGDTLNADSSNGTLFGHLFDSVASGATETVRVRLKQ